MRYCASELSQIQPRPLPTTLFLTQHSMKLCAVVAFCNVSAICLFCPAEFRRPQREGKLETSDLWVVSLKCFLWDQTVSWQSDKFYVQESTKFSLPAQNMSLLIYYQITTKYADEILLAPLQNLFLIMFNLKHSRHKLYNRISATKQITHNKLCTALILRPRHSELFNRK